MPTLDEINAKLDRVLALLERPASAPRTATSTGPTFPNYGKSKGAPVAGASIADLEYYAAGCRRTLADSAKERWHEKERALLAAIEAEVARQGGTAPGRDDDDNLPF